MKSLISVLSSISLILFLTACGGGNAESGDNGSSEQSDKKEGKEDKAEDKGPETLNIGDELPMADHKMKGIDGEEHSLAGSAKANGLLVNFTCNTCPFVEAWDDRYTPLQEIVENEEIGHVLLNPNTKKRDAGDSFEDMKRYAEKNHPGIPYLLDEKSKVANAFGAKTTPHVFLFNSDLELVYRGRIDKSFKKSFKEARQDPETNYLINGIEAMSAGEAIDPEVTDAKGCSIKRP